MAISVEDTYPGRAVAASANYPEGSIKNESIPGTSDDGTPLDLTWGNDFEGVKQALLRAAGVVPSAPGNVPDTALFSQMLQAIVEIAAGRAIGYTDTGLVDAYVASLKANQQGVASYFDGMTVEITVSNNNTGPCNINVQGTNGTLLGIKSIKTAAGLDPEANVLITTRRDILRYDGVNDWFEIVEYGGGGQLLGNAATKAIAYNAQNVSEDITIQATMNALSAGDITIDATKTVTIETGGVWVIV